MTKLQMLKDTQWGFAGALMVILLAAGGCSPLTERGPGQNVDSDTSDPGGHPVVGGYVSAEEPSGSSYYRGGPELMEDDVAMDAEADGVGGDERTVEEGDIYRVLGGDLILNLNSYRGLQVIDFSDVANPEIVGRFAITGSPVEMYVIGDQALVLLNHWYGYYGTRDDVEVEHRQGGLALLVDISDPTAPVEQARAFVPGYIQTSRLTRQGDLSALYVAANFSGYHEGEGGEWIWESSTYVKSFEVGAGSLDERSEFDLGGYVEDIQATPEALLVARYDWNSYSYRSQVTAIDISSPTGEMVLGDTIETAGHVENKFNMDLDGGVLRVVSGNQWGGDNWNHVETFDAGDLSQLTPIDDCTFGQGQQLFATLFLGEKAFFVTYMQVDPFHAFSIDAAGHCQEQSEFVVSGWNDYFRSVYGDTRLMGIGVNDEDGRTMAVSLYDITDLTNPAPLIVREEVAAEQSWSNASFDDKAFSVLEDAVSISAPSGVEETGLVLLPFQGWDDATEKYAYNVQIYTFSESTLTRRGVMDHGSSVRRSFLADAETTANLSEDSLSLFDHTDPDAPLELGRLDLAPNYTNIFAFGDHFLRVRSPLNYYYWYVEPNAPLMATAEVISRAEDPDGAEPLATFELRADAQLIQAGNRLVATSSEVIDWSEWPYLYETTIDVWNLANPAQPLYEGRLVTDRLQGNGGGYYNDCLGCESFAPYYYGGTMNAVAIDNAVVFTSSIQHDEVLGTETVCQHQPVWENTCYQNANLESCLLGSVTCYDRKGLDEYCVGSIQSCHPDDTGDWRNQCTKTLSYQFVTTQSCYEREIYRYWNSYELHVVALGASGPLLADPVSMPAYEEGVGVVPAAEAVYYNYKIPVSWTGESHPHVRYFIKRLDLSSPTEPLLEQAINVPGTLLHVQGDRIFTRDFQWTDDYIETELNKLRIVGGQAIRDASFRFEDRSVQTVALDGAGHVLVVHRPDYYFYDYGGYYYNYGVAGGYSSNLSILSVENLYEYSEVEVDSWATLNGAEDGRALFSVPGGLLVMNFINPIEPFAQAYFAVYGWPRQVVLDGGDIVFAAGRYGVTRLDAHAFNLLETNAP